MFKLKNLPLTISTIVLVSLIVGWGISMVLAWVGPTASPPLGNVSAPINVSGTGQVKAGTFGARINAIYITSGTFGTETGGGNYTFNNSVGGPLLFLDATNTRVGIGTTGPGAKLEVKGGNKSVLVNWVDTAATPANLTEVRSFYAYAYAPLRSGNTNGFYISHTNALPMLQGVTSSNTANDILLQPFGGNIGIGTTGPEGKLDIKMGTGAGIGWNAGLNLINGTYKARFIQDATVLRIRNEANGGIQFNTIGGGYVLTIQDSGNISMTGNLTVSGTISGTFSGNAENLTTPVGTYKHVGAWGVGRTAAGAILVNTAYTADYASYAAEATNNYFYVRGTSPSTLYVDTDQGQTRYVHHNGGLIGFLSSAGGWILRVGDDSNVIASTFTGALSGNATTATTAAGLSSAAAWNRSTTAYGYIDFGPANASWAHIYSDKNFYFNQNLYVNGTQVVTNFGTWGINITGNANTLDNIDSSQFLRSDTSDTMSGSLTVGGDVSLGNSSSRWFKNGNAWFGRNASYDTAEIRGYGAELMIGAQSADAIHINYRQTSGANAPATWYWRKGSSSSWSDHHFGSVTVNGNLTVSGTISGTFSGNAENLTTPVGTYKHVGAWGVGRTAAGAILVNTAYTADYAARATRANGNFYIDDNYGNSVVGVYTSTRYQGVYAMGDAYKLAADGSTTGSLYGLAWSHPNAGGVASNLNTHGLLVMENGTFLAAISGSIRARDDMRAPIFYDSNNTGYYVDPNGTSNIEYVTNRTKSRLGLTGLYNSPRSDYTSDTRYWTGVMGWGITDFNTIYSNWGSGFFDTWSNPGNAPGGSSHYVGIQGFHLNHGDGTNAYGWQMAMAGESNNRFFWRSGWPSPRSWVEMIHSGNIGAQSVNYAASAGNANSCNNDGICEIQNISATGQLSVSGNGIVDGWFYPGRNGVVGSYDSTQIQNVYAMGTSYVPNISGTGDFGTLYGMAYCHTNNANCKAGYGHQFDIANAGVIGIALGFGGDAWFKGSVTMNKLYVTTIDPIYEIDGKKYATYVADFAGGVRTETSGLLKLEIRNPKSETNSNDQNTKFQTVIDFDDLEKGSDLWLFWETSNKNMDDLVVILTPAFVGRVGYNKDGHKLTIYGDPSTELGAGESGEVSYRLTLPRLDDEEWGNAVEK